MNIPRALLLTLLTGLLPLALAACGTTLVAVGVPVVQYSATAWQGYDLASKHFPRRRIDYRDGLVIPQDRTIARRINERLDMDPQLADCDLAAYAHLGHVWLVGRCADFGQVEHATQTVRATDGVRGITRLVYPADEAGDDATRAATARSIRRALDKDITLRHRPVDVDVVAGRAVLMGLVPTESERSKVVDIARRTRGVSRVASYIAVVPAGKEDGEPS